MSKTSKPEKPRRPSRLGGPLPYYKWLPLDYRASRNANALSYIARGLYRELLDECWLEGHIPDDLAKLAQICRCSLSVMQREWVKLRPMFIPIAGMDDMLLTNAKLEAQRTESDAIRVKRAMAARSSKCEQVLTKRDSSSSKHEHRAGSTDSATNAGTIEPIVAIGTPPAPHGAACLTDLARDMTAKIARGEIRREQLQ